MAAMAVTPQTRPPALATRFDPPLPRLPLPEKGPLVVEGSVMLGSVKLGSTIVGVLNGVVGCGATVWLVVGTTAGVLISSPGMISGESPTLCAVLGLQ